MPIKSLVQLAGVVLIFSLFSIPTVSPIAQAEQTTASPDKTAALIKYEGIDVSHYQGHVDWAAVKAAGITFAFTKATQGHSEVDSKFKTNWAAMKKAGLVRGVYHFFEPELDAEAQAKHLIATVKLEPGDLPPVIDIEVTEGVSKEGIEDDIRGWLEKVAEAYGVQPIIYSDLAFLKEKLAHGFGSYPLWVADYSHSAPKAPGDWKAWIIWQYSQEGTVDGIQGKVDRDVYRGTKEDWQQLLIPAKE